MTAILTKNMLQWLSLIDEYMVHITNPSCLSGKWAEQVNRIYLGSFRPSHRIEFSEIVQSVAEGRRLIFVADMEGDAVGFATVCPLSYGNSYFLEYFAVDPQLRSAGIGSTLLGRVAQTLRSDQCAAGIIFEVEPDEGPEAEQNRRRIRFYVQNGAVLMDHVEYHMPALSGEGSMPMTLMWLPLNRPVKTLDNQMLRDYIICIYADIYERQEDDPLLQSILQGVSPE